MGSKAKAKKKGPKGRKARAKAKLEQVWGETVDESARAASKTRVGKSRYLHKEGRGSESIQKAKALKGREVDPLYEKRRGVKSTFDRFLERRHAVGGSDGRRQDVRWNERGRQAECASSSEDNGSDSGDESMEGANGGSFSALLQRIGGRKSRMAVDSDDESVGSSGDSSASEASSSEGSDGDADMQLSDDESDQSSSESEDDSPDNAENGKAVAEGMAKADANIPSPDPYDAHFSRPSLPQLDSLQSSPLVPHTGNGRKVDASLLDASTEVQLAGPILDMWDEIAGNGDGANNGQKGSLSTKKKELTRRAWEDFAAGPYQHVRQALTRNWKGCNRPALKRAKKGDTFSPLQLALYPSIARYADVLVTSETRSNRDELYNLLALHVLNHVLTSRTRVQRHNRRLKELAGEADDADKPPNEGSDDKWRDQGYSRPKVLILLPTRGTCWTFVRQLTRLLGDAAMIVHEERFDEEYGPIDPEDDASDDGEDAAAKKVRRASVLKQKGAEWNELFGDEVNADDDFKLGIAVTPNAVRSAKKKGKKHAGKDAAGASGVNVKLFAEFYRSDIIVASPIGLKMSITNSSDDEDDEAESDVDFLSSIDVCLVLRSDVMLMQNWDHVAAVLDALNRQPKNVADVDFFEGAELFPRRAGGNWRQTIVVSQFSDPYILSTFRRHASNVEGQMRVRRKVAADDASVCDVLARARQVFQRVTCRSAADAGADRLRYFAEHVLPKLTRLKQKHTLIYIPSYFDFVAVRNLLLKKEVKFVSVTEYARVSEVSRGRARFLQGLKPIMLYTGRAHFFLRHRIKGARHVVFFGLPEHAEFYPAVANMLNDGVAGVGDDEDGSRAPRSCLALFTKFDAHQLERIVGTAHAGRMIKGEKSSYMFCA
ncbi:hypothetical protein ACHAXT_008783 [Thalassiosira profunda]